MKRAIKTPAFLGPGGKVIPGSIAEASFVRLGGFDQWVMIRGENVDNPVLVVLHGGPGFSDTAFLRYHTPELEKSFTVVYWDQRGTGRSYRPSIPRASMTVAQFMDDLDELVEIVRRRFGKEKVAILGHSWGSALGVLYAARFPEKVAVYVGVAQVGDAAAGEVASYEHAVAEAERQGKGAVLRKLRAIGPPPHTAKTLFVERTCAQHLAGGLKPKALFDTARMLLRVPEASVLDLRTTIRAFRFSIECMWPEVSRLNLLEAVPALDVPVVFMLGRRDPWIPPEASVAYYDVLRAPSKKLVWFEESGHEPFVDEPCKFLGIMRDGVRRSCGPSPDAADVRPLGERAVEVRTRTLRAFVQAHPATTYFALTFAISWSAVLVAIARHGLLMAKEDFERVFPMMLPFVVLGPSVSGLLMTGIAEGKVGLRDYFSRLVRWRVALRWYAVALLTAPLYFTASMLALAAFSSTRAFLPGIFTTDALVPYVFRGIAVALVAGVVEELGWTGFAIPTLRRRLGPMSTGLIVGGMWGLWHVLPKVTGSAAHDLVPYMPVDLASAVVGLTGYRVLMVWVYDRTQSLLIGILMHMALTASTLLLQPTVGGARLVPVIVVLTIVPWVIVAVTACVKLVKRGQHAQLHWPLGAK